MNNQPYSHGNWTVNEGKEEEFIKAWTTFVKWATENGMVKARLLKDQDNPLHFVSFGLWNRLEDIEKWMNLPEFQEHMQKLKSMSSIQAFTLTQVSES